MMSNPIDILMNRALPFEGTKIQLLDQLTRSLSSSNLSQVNEASNVWKILSDDPNFWLSSDQILLNSTNNYTKFLTLVIMENGIKTKWLALPAEERQGIKNYIVNMVITFGADPSRSKQLETLLSKANSILVQIVKYQWNTTWKSFIPDICSASKNNHILCQNNLTILRMLMEQIFEFGKNQMTIQQMTALKDHMHQQFTIAFELCHSVLHSAGNVNPALIKSALQTLYVFLLWIPAYYIFFSGVIDDLIPLISSDFNREAALRCLTQITCINIIDISQKTEDMKMKEFKLLTDCLDKFDQLIPLEKNIDFSRLLSQGSQSFALEITFQNIVSFFISILQNQYEWLVEKGSTLPLVAKKVKLALKWLTKLIRLPYEQTYRMIVEFFHFLTKKYQEWTYKQSQSFKRQDSNSMMSLVGDSFKEVMEVIVLRMVKPQQVLITTDQTGYPIKQEVQNAEINAFYQTIKQLLINLATLDWPSTKLFILTQIEKQKGQHFTFNIINSLSWAVGSLSGFIPEGEQQEKPFLIANIRILLQLCLMQTGTEIKAVIASCIMYIVGQYPDFLKSNWVFEKTILNKLFEFMKEAFPGVKEMACNTFLKIAENTKEQFVCTHEGEQHPMILDMIQKLPEFMNSLGTDTLKLTLYEAFGHIISSETNMETKTYLIAQTLKSHQHQFENIIENAKAKTAILQMQEAQNKIMEFLRINEKLALSVGFTFCRTLISFSETFNNLYIYYLNAIANKVTVEGKRVLNYVTIKKMKGICKQILKVYNTYMKKCSNLNQSQAAKVIQQIVIPLIELFSKTYSQPVPQLKDPEFLTLMTTIFENLNGEITHDIVMKVIQTVFGAALPMISSDFNSHPEIRLSFFEFLKSIIKFNFEQLYNMPGEKFHTIMDCIMWAIKHQLGTFSQLGLQLLYDTLSNLAKCLTTANAFFERYYINILKDLLQVLTDGYHKSGFKLQCKILFFLLEIVTSNYLSVRIGGITQAQPNKEFICNFLINILSGAFKNVSVQATTHKIQTLLSINNQKTFKAEIGDYLVMINRYTTVQQKEIQVQQ